MKNKSWKTTVAGSAALFVSLGAILNDYLDNDPATNPDWRVQLPIVALGLVGLFARDNDKSSEDVGAAK